MGTFVPPSVTAGAADGTIDVLRLLVGWLVTIRLTAAMADQLDDALDFWRPRRGPDGAADRDLDGEVRGIARVLRGMMEGRGDRPEAESLLKQTLGVPPLARG